MNFGEAYCQLSQVIRISPERYRIVEGAVADQTIEFQGEKIPITRENSARIGAAIGALQRANEDARSEILGLGSPLDVKTPVAETSRILSLHNRMDLWLKQANAMRGDLKGYWSVSISGNWRIVFRFEDGDVFDVDLVDYQ